MPNFSGYTIDEYARLLSVSRWAFGVLALCAIAAGIFTQWVASQMLDLQAAEQAKMKEHFLASQSELHRVSHNTVEVAGALGRLTDPRKITDAQSEAMRKLLRTGPKGKVVITFLSVEWDAEKYARQIADLLTTAGFNVIVSDHLWVHLDYDGLFLCSRDAEELPAGSSAAHLHECFVAAGIHLGPSVKSGEICRAIAAPDDAVVLVVSNRNQ